MLPEPLTQVPAISLLRQGALLDGGAVLPAGIDPPATRALAYAVIVSPAPELGGRLKRFSGAAVAVVMKAVDD